MPPAPRSSGSDRQGTALIIALALAGLVLLVSTLLWFAGDDTRDDDEAAAASQVLTPAAQRERTRGQGIARREADSANAPRVDPNNPTHLALAASLSQDPSPYGALEGRVVNWSTRVGVAGAELEFVSGGVSHGTTTGLDGSYRFVAPSAGTWSLAIVTADGYLPYAPELGSSSVVYVASPYQKLERADLFLFPAVDYQGTVVDAKGRPVADAEIELFGADSGELALVGIESSFVSDADGRFEFHAPDFALLEARHPDHPPGRARVDDAAQLSHTLTIKLGGAPAGSDAAIRGRVIDAAGQPLAGVEVAALPTGIGGRDPRLARVPAAVSDDQGRFTLAPIDALTYVVEARLGARPRVRSQPVEPGGEVELRVDDGLEIEGRLVDDQGAVVVAANVTLLRVQGPLRRARVAAQSVFDAGGAFSFTGLTPGDYELEATAQGRARSKPVAVKLPDASGPITLVLGSGGAVFGRVVDAQTHEPLAHANVSVGGSSASASVLAGVSSTVTDADGAFELTGIETGRISIEVVAYGHDGRVVSGIELEAGERHGPVEVELAPVAEGAKPKTEFVGIGVAIAPRRDAIMVIDVIEGGGAEAAGIQVGDAITGVDGMSVLELGFEAATQNIRGEVGTTVRVELRRKGVEDDRRETVIVQRRLIPGA